MTDFRQLELFDQVECVPSARPNWLRFVVNHNPFYVLSVCLVLYGFHVSFDSSEQIADGRLLLNLFGGYSLLLVLSAILIVRVGAVWEDARTIVLLVLVLVVALSASFDRVCLDSVRGGQRIQLMGFLGSMAMIELLLRGVGARLAFRYRGPLYAQFALLFYYPTLLGDHSINGRNLEMAWSVFLYPAIASAALLLFLPAARLAGRGEPESGTPWTWPLYPWCGLGFLAVALVVRAYGMSVSFELASGLLSAFHWYYLIPLVIALATLLAELALACKRRLVASRLIVVATSVTIVLAFPGTDLSLVQSCFLGEVQANIGAPIQWSTALLAVFAAYFWYRGLIAAEWCVVLTVLLFACSGQETIGPSMLHRPHVGIAICLATYLISRSLFQRPRSSFRFLAGSSLLASAITSVPSLNIIANQELVLCALCCFVVGLLFNDWIARCIRSVLPLVANVAVLVVLSRELWRTPMLNLATSGQCCLGSLMLCIYWWRDKTPQHLRWVLLNFFLVAGHAATALSQRVLVPLQFAGQVWILFGCLFLLVGLAVSFIKAGMLQVSALSVSALNRRLCAWTTSE
ncbi:MAG: hypothetical protein KDB27_03470 [Planctomycetales bacterium]|nr:hypothetical protein [Planctomycetales bacterium]